MKEKSKRYASRVSPELDQDRGGLEDVFEDDHEHAPSDQTDEDDDHVAKEFAFDSNPPSTRSTMYSDDGYEEAGGQMYKQRHFKKAGCCEVSEEPLPVRNVCGCDTRNSFRMFCLVVAVNPWVNRIWFWTSIIHSTFLIAEFQTAVFDCTVDNSLDCIGYIPNWINLIFVAIYLIELLIKSVAFGFFGGKFAYYTYDFYNKIDLWITIFCVLEIILSYVDVFVSFRSFRLLRLIKSLSKFSVLNEIKYFFQSIVSSMIPLSMVMILILFMFVLFGVAGMSFYQYTYRRRCVWSDTLEIKQPEQWCKRYADKLSLDGSVLGLENTCGPLQSCLDIGNPNYGFSSFDNMAAALISLFQAFSTDGQYQIMWAALQGEPDFEFLTFIYFIIFAFAVGQVLINVFLAVFANVFSKVREKEPETEKAGGLENQSESFSTVEENTSKESDKNNGNGQSHLPKLETAEMGKDSESKYKKKTDEASKIYQRIMKAYVAFQEQTKRKIQTSVMMSMVFRSVYYDTLLFLAIMTNSLALAMEGSLTGPNVDSILLTIENFLSLFFFCNVFLQIICDGSLHKHFENGENVFEFIVTLLTTTALIAEFLGAGNNATSVLRGAGILRLMRGLKFSFLRPIWLMLIKAVSAGVSVINLILFISILTAIFSLTGRSLFVNRISNAQANFDDFGRSCMTLFQVMTGDSWSGLMYQGMDSFCSANEGTCSDLSCSTCPYGYVLVAALFYVFFFWIGQFVFITMFLALVLEKFSVEEFMTSSVSKTEDVYLDFDAAIEEVAKYQKLAPALVARPLIEQAFIEVADKSTNTIEKSKLLSFVKMKQPMLMWRFLKVSRLYDLYQGVKKCLACFRSSKSSKLPSSLKIAPSESLKMIDRGSIEKKVAKDMREDIKLYMSKLAAFGILGEVTIHAIKLGIANQVNFRDLKLTPVDAALKILRNPDIAWRLGIPNLFENRIEQEVANARLKSEAPIDESNQFATEERDSFRSKMNRLLVRLADSKTFDNIVLIAITMSTVFLTFETPSRLIPGPVSYELLDLMNILFTIIFTVEAVAKIGANGLLLPNSVEHTAYWQSIPNRMDFIVLAFNLAELFGIGALVGTRTSKLIRISKALRPLRLMSRFEGTRAIVKALVGSVKPISYAVLFLFINCSIFAVTGMALFRDKFYSCNDGSLDGLLGEGRTQCAGQFLNEDVYSPRSWSNPPAGTHFDTFPDGVLALFRVITLKWNAIWITGQDAYEVNLQPVQNYNSFVATVFFALFIFVGSFFSLNLFVSFICDGFYASQGVDTSEEIQWASIRDMIKRHLPARERVYPDNLTARYARGVVLSYQFRYFSAGCLLVNIMCMSSSHVNPSSSFSLFLSVQNDVFFGIMCLEFVLDLLGFGPEIAFTQGSGFDFFLIVATIFVMTFESSFRSAGQVVRLLRLFRFLMTLSSHSLVASIFETVVLSTVQTANIMVVLLVSMIVFAVLFVQLFGTTKYGSRLGPQANYFTFYSAMLTLFQIIFGDEWHQLMDDCSINFPSCTPTVYDRNGNELRIGDCGTRVGSLLGYHFYMIIVHYTILNLFIGMIMNNFAYITTKDSQGVIKEAEVKTISRIWVQILDPKASGCVKLHQVYKFLSAIGSPLGFYDSGNNLHRYLCIREDLSRQLKILEENRDHGNKGFLFFLKDLESKLYQEANNQWKTVQNQAEEYRKQLESYYSGNKSFKSDLVGKDAQHEGTDSDASAENDDSPSDTENQVHVSGGNMGSKRDRGRVRVKKIKRIDSSKALDKIITDLQTKSKRELKRLEREAKEKEMFALQASQFSKPTVTSYMRMISFLRWLSELFVSRQKILETHRSYEVLLYTEVLETCLVWMKKSILPSRIAHNKNDYLDSIRSTASTQLATAVIKGGIQRRRFRAIKKMTNALFTSTHFLKKNRRNLLKQTRSSSFKIRSFGLDSKRAEEILLSNHSDALVKFAKLVKYRFITESEILEIAEEGGVVVQEEDIMDVDEFMLNQILSLQEISILIPHIDLREKLDDLIEKGYENSLWKLARSMGFIAGNSARLSSLSHAQVSELLHKFEEDSSEKNNIAESQARMKQYKLQMAQYREIKGSLSDITRGNQEITRVILETRKKCDELQKERSKLMKTDRTYAADDSS